MAENIQPVIGYDNRGAVYDAGGHILRKIFPEYFDEVAHLFDLYRAANLERCGIVLTELNRADKSLQHKKHVVSYPFEWTATMFKDAVLFHLNLFVELDKHGLTLKDALPCNIVFDFYKPVFIDFLSLIDKGKLKQEEWLAVEKVYPDPRFCVFEKMFIPFIIIPFSAIVKKDYKLARKMLWEKACNCRGYTPVWRDVKISAPDYLKEIIKKVLNVNHEAKAHFTSKMISEMRHFLNNKERYDFIEFCRGLIMLIENIDVTPPKSAYFTYYNEKDENFDMVNQSGWKSKQKNIYKIINDIKPGKVLDLGANTGWFSILAEKLGSEVIAADIDESLVDSLYLYVKRNKLKILPLLLSFDDLTKQLYGMEDHDPVYQGRDFKTIPLFSPAVSRFKSDLVLCLGLLHHLILGEGKEINDVLEVLSKFGNKTLVLEYIDLKDNLINKEPSFFKNLYRYSSANYNMDMVISAGKKHFRNVHILDSYPDTRKLLIFER